MMEEVFVEDGKEIEGKSDISASTDRNCDEIVEGVTAGVPDAKCLLVKCSPW